MKRHAGDTLIKSLMKSKTMISPPSSVVAVVLAVLLLVSDDREDTLFSTVIENVYWR